MLDSPVLEELFAFTARPFDADTLLQNNLNRWYDALVGRWLSEDPVQSSPNLYEYCGDNPLARTDPSGLEPTVEACCERNRGERESYLDRINREFDAADAKLKKELLACCAAASDAAKKKACEKEVDLIMAGLKKARDCIYTQSSESNGAWANDYCHPGPSYFKYTGPVCTDCQETVNKYLGPIGKPGSYFEYSGVATYKTCFGILVPFTSHNWGEIKCKNSGAVITIDFWKGGTDYWRIGQDAYGYKRRCNCD
jgi:RHS repeat-associated protein